jgi:hypothetical protein
MPSDYSGISKYCSEHGVTLLAVSKTKTPDEILAVYHQGHRIFGENKVQELVSKYETLPKDIEWHLIGHLQTNKVKYVVPFVAMIQSVDSWKLLREIDKEAKKKNRNVKVLLQIHIATEETKFGLSYEEAEQILSNPELKDLTGITVSGLMGMASLTDDEQQIRREFRGLKNFFERYRTLQASNINLQTLSMGMSSDYTLAIEEGSNMVRIGSAIFGERR